MDHRSRLDSGRIWRSHGNALSALVFATEYGKQPCRDKWQRPQPRARETPLCTSLHVDRVIFVEHARGGDVFDGRGRSVVLAWRERIRICSTQAARQQRTLTPAALLTSIWPEASHGRNRVDQQPTIQLPDYARENNGLT